MEDARSFYIARGNGFGIRAMNLDYDSEERYFKIGFTQKDMYNKIAKIRTSKAFESDSQAAILYLESKAFYEQKFHYRDVLVFDTTYKTNAYGKPVVLFVGANNHSATCVFGAALLLDKTITPYKWAFTKLMDSMGIKHPISIMTDGDEAMQQAIDEVFQTVGIGYVDGTREKLFDLFPQIDRALMRLRNNFFTDEYASNSKSPVILSHIKSLEKHASSIYTYCIYCDITKEINDSMKYSHFASWNEENEVEYVLTEYDSPYEKINITKIPESLTFKRWTKSATDDVRIQLQPDDDYSKSVDIARFASVDSATISVTEGAKLKKDSI
ncbi:hypothetical protein Dsin_017165 [Dipteronia sinensis]|uniref:MULE transposase domain-containing protein n=1 Tax=Dipteronia sinensis TaxID=43782 RepID=A0AAE0AET5_9ROSI|nr:hypothetical protein Dsin_017165 [Dipteronia sinensis]